MSRRAFKPSTGRLLVVIGVVTVIAAVALAATARGPGPSPRPSLPAALAAGSGIPTPASSGSAATPEPSTLAPRLPIVPVVGFWSTALSLSTAELRLALAGHDPRYPKVVVGAPDLAAVAAALGVQAGPKVEQLAPAAAIAAVEGTVNLLGLIRATDVRPSVRVLGVDGQTLFGETRVRSLEAWPLSVVGASAFDPGAVWTLAAAGDVMNDREVYRRAVLLRDGPDFPWHGGTARIVSRTCCRDGLTDVTAVRTGGAGAVAALFRNADLALVNHEGPTPDHFTYHPSGLTFTFDPALEAGLHDAGVDVVSLANNHIRNAGSAGVMQTIRNVKAADVVPVGAGADLAAANAPAWFTVDGVRVAVLAFDAIDLGSAGATTSRPGAAPLDLAGARADIAAARAAGAQVVVVVPHWGVEYTSTPTAVQRRDAAALIADGADVILGSHPHWAGALEAIGTGVVVYSMGDFIFDLPRSEQTDEGLIVELTFDGSHLAQIALQPTIELDRSQPNLLDPASAGGQVVLGRVRAASRSFLHW